MLKDEIFKTLTDKGMSVEEAFYTAFEPTENEFMRKLAEMQGADAVPLLFNEQGDGRLDPGHLADWMKYTHTVLYDDSDRLRAYFLVDGEKRSDTQLCYKILEQLPSHYRQNSSHFMGLVKQAVELLKVQSAITPERAKLSAVKIDWTDEDLFKPEFWCNGLIPKEEMSLFYGKSGAGKTTSLLKMAEMLSNGRPMFGQSGTPCKVAYLDFENHPMKFKLALEITGAPFPPHFDVYTLDSGQYPASEVVELLEGFKGYDVVFLDNLWCFSESSPYEPKEIVTYLKELEVATKKLKIHLIIAHHSSKASYGSGSNKGSSDNASGSAQLINSFATCFEARREAGTYYTQITKTRYANGIDDLCFDFVKEAVVDNPAARNLDRTNEIRKKKSEQTGSAVMDSFNKLKESGKLSELTTGQVHELIAKEANCGEKVVQNRLRAAEIAKTQIKGKWYYTPLE